MNRRGFILGLGSALVAAPSIVRAASLMPVRGIVMPAGSWAAKDWFSTTSVVLNRETLIRLIANEALRDYEFWRGDRWLTTPNSRPG